MKRFLIMILLYGMNVTAQPWQEVAQMAPAEAAKSDFGVRSVFADDLLVVSWPKTYSTTPSVEGCGEVITYQKNAGIYEEISRLTAADLVGECLPGDGFGWGLSYNDGRLAIGMPAGARAGIGLDGQAGDEDSRVFITVFSAGNWQLEETLVADDLAPGNGMGFYLVLEGDLLLVHGHEYDSIFGFQFVESNAVYVFEDAGDGFVQLQKLTENHRFFGQDFDTENGQIVVGAWGEQTIGAAGKIFVYEKNSESWDLVQTINDPNNRNLGNQIEIIGDTMVAGSVTIGRVGAVQVFSRESDGWQLGQLIEASDSAMNDQFGIALTMHEDELIVGASAGTNQIQTIGAVYYYTRNSEGQYEVVQKIESPLQNEAADQFGSSLIFNDTDLLVTEASGRFSDLSVTNFWHYSRENDEVPPAININQRTSGVWQVEGVEGQAMNLEILDDNQAVMYLNYANENGSTWLFSVGSINQNKIQFNEVFKASGPKFGDDFDSSDLSLQAMGQANFQINTCETGSLDIQIGSGNNQQFDLSKTFAISSLDCQSNSKTLENGISGSWFNPERSGEGFSVYTHHGLSGEQTASVHWYTYDNEGNPIYYSGQASVEGTEININELKQYSSGVLFESSSEPSTVGSLIMAWPDCINGMFSYDLTTAGLGTGAYELAQITRVKGSSCQ